MLIVTYIEAYYLDVIFICTTVPEVLSSCMLLTPSVADCRYSFRHLGKYCCNAVEEQVTDN